MVTLRETAGKEPGLVFWAEETKLSFVLACSVGFFISFLQENSNEIENMTQAIKRIFFINVALVVKKFLAQIKGVIRRVD